jgi:predicted O-methyltransferase YrrM
MKARVLAYVRAIYDRLAQRQIAGCPTLHRELRAYLQRSGSTGCNHLDYWELYRAVRRLKPREILECGTGVSTVVLAIALAENERETGIKGRITSAEEIPKYFEMAKSIFPSAYAHYVDFVLSPRIEDNIGMFRGVRYRDIPNRPYDFVFVDGPDYRAPSDGSLTFDFDFIHVLRHSERPIHGLVDKRVSTCFVLQRLLGSALVRYDATKHLGFIGPASRTDIRQFNPKAPSEAFLQSFCLVGNSELSF